MTIKLQWGVTNKAKVKDNKIDLKKLNERDVFMGFKEDTMLSNDSLRRSSVEHASISNGCDKLYKHKKCGEEGIGKDKNRETMLKCRSSMDYVTPLENNMFCFSKNTLNKDDLSSISFNPSDTQHTSKNSKKCSNFSNNMSCKSDFRQKSSKSLISYDVHCKTLDPNTIQNNVLCSEESSLNNTSKVELSFQNTGSIGLDVREGSIVQEPVKWIETIWQKRTLKHKRRQDDESEKVFVGTRIGEDHVNYVTAYNMLTGIRVGVSRCTAKVDRDLKSTDFVDTYKFSFDITGNELTPSAKYDFKFKDYSPWVFRHLRALFHLDPADYLMSLTSKYILSELGSPGKSGSFFYFSRDYRYIIKTIHHSEHKFLRTILKQYYEHVKKNPNTLISQFYGLHRVKMPHGHKIHFVIMNNLFPPHRDIHKTFDLKGSTIGRDYKEEDLEKNPRATMKDLNWIRRNMYLSLGPKKRDVFLAQVKADIELLASLNIMDYSLLVGIHDLSLGNKEHIRDNILSVFNPDSEQIHNSLKQGQSISNVNEVRKIVSTTGPVSLNSTSNELLETDFTSRKDFIFYSDDGGFRATQEDDLPGDSIYYIGIIDLLTKYNIIKKAEHFWKGLSHSRAQVSAIPPSAYALRFFKFISSIIKTP